MWTISATPIDFLFLTSSSGGNTTKNGVNFYLRDEYLVRGHRKVFFRSLRSMSDEFHSLFV